MAHLPPQYTPKDVEERLYQQWESSGLFRAEVSRSKTPYTIVIPPPNVTGILHMGHALNNTIQDILIRFKRMQGRNALWVPGTDHAGIATQNVVEKDLAKEGKTRADLGREAFIGRVWKWKEQYGNTIIYQLKRLGASCDWSRTRFTMDEGLSDAVAEVFIRLYKKGLIYRGNYIINWCPRCQTALSDEEAPRKETRGKLYYMKYPLVTSDQWSVTSGRKSPVTGHQSLVTSHFIVVATTRPETMLGDTAVAVHPKDKRYKALIGKKAVLPLVNRELSIIADELVDPEFGTGAVKVTPAHDPVDFQLAKKHTLEFLNVMTDDGRMVNVPQVYANLDRFECRTKVLADLGQAGLLEKIEDHLHGVGHCYRCNTVVEPRLSLQWFVKMKPLAQPAIRVVKERKVTFAPARWTKVYLNWMENIQDWCISRQIWWGHRLPVYYCQTCTRQAAVHRPQSIVHSKGKKAVDRGLSTVDQVGVIVSKTRPSKCPSCHGTDLRQDKDVLDTWFSSWLWPFSTLGWPKKTKDLDYFYPTDTLVTAPEIIFFWVARMIMAGLFCLKEIPFKQVYIHGTVRDLTGKKMSKSLGNIIDPLEIINQYGTDALRYTLVTSTAIGQDIFLSEEKFETGRNFANKLWNATRFLLSQGAVPTSMPKAQTIADRWILSRLQDTVKKVTTALEAMLFNEAASSLYDFLWHDVCDWYIEISKYVQPAEKENARAVLAHLLEVSMRLLHPFMPFVTEELWQQLRPAGSELSIMVSAWPAPDKKFVDTKAGAQFECFKAVVTSIRTTRAELNIPSDRKTPTVWLISKDAATRRFFHEHQNWLQALAQVSAVAVLEDFRRQRDATTTVVNGVEVVIPLGGLIDVERERSRIQERVDQLTEELGRLKARLKDRQFVTKAPQEVVDGAKARSREVTETLKKFSEHLHVLQSM